MTCIAAVIEKGRVWMGGDSAVSDDDGAISCAKEPKVWINNGWLVGVSGWCSWCDALELVSWPSLKDPNKIARWVRFDLPIQLRSKLREIDDLDEAGNPTSTGHALIARTGRIWHLEGMTARSAQEPYQTAGDGGQVAMGVLGSNTGKPRQRILEALTEAEKHRWSVRRPFVVLSI